MDNEIYEKVCKMHGHHYVAVCLDAKSDWKLFCDKCGDTKDLNIVPQKTKVAA